MSGAWQLDFQTPRSGLSLPLQAALNTARLLRGTTKEQRANGAAKLVPEDIYNTPRTRYDALSHRIMHSASLPPPSHESSTGHFTTRAGAGSGCSFTGRCPSRSRRSPVSRSLAKDLPCSQRPAASSAKCVRSCGALRHEAHDNRGRLHARSTPWLEGSKQSRLVRTQRLCALDGGG